MGAFEIATSSDTSCDEFKVQDFQCKWYTTNRAVAVGVAIKVQETIVFMSNRKLEVNGTPMTAVPDGIDLTGTLATRSGVIVQSSGKCSRINVKTHPTGNKSP